MQLLTKTFFWTACEKCFRLMCQIITNDLLFCLYLGGGAFLRKFARVPGTSSGQWKCAFCLTRDGKAVKIQRTIFSECFYILAMDELSRVTGDEDMQVQRHYLTTLWIIHRIWIGIAPFFLPCWFWFLAARVVHGSYSSLACLYPHL